MTSELQMALRHHLRRNHFLIETPADDTAPPPRGPEQYRPEPLPFPSWYNMDPDAPPLEMTEEHGWVPSQNPVKAPEPPKSEPSYDTNPDPMTRIALHEGVEQPKDDHPWSAPEYGPEDAEKIYADMQLRKAEREKQQAQEYHETPLSQALVEWKPPEAETPQQQRHHEETQAHTTHSHATTSTAPEGSKLDDDTIRRQKQNQP
jgi:hypothetical protein